jgi:hypothetical protein
VFAGRHASSFVVTDSTAQPNSTNSDTLSPTESEALVREFNVGVFLSTLPIWFVIKLIPRLRVKLGIHFT